jgi:hypothetical protein
MRLGVAAEPERSASAPDTVHYYYDSADSVAVGLVSQPTVGARTRSKGSLYVVVAAAGAGAQKREAGLVVADAIRQHYYYDESAGIGEVLEKAVRVADQRLRQQHDRLGVALGSVSVAAAVVRENELYLTTIGEAVAYLLRQARLLVLPDEGRDMALPSADGHILPPVWHGELALGDTLALTTHELPGAIGAEELKNAVVTLHPQSAAEHLHHLYLAAGADGADPLLILEATEVPATAVGRPLIPVRAQEPFAGQPERSPIPLADTVTEQAAAIGGAARLAQERARRGLARLLGRAQDSLPRREAPRRRVTAMQSRVETQRRFALAILALLGVVVVLGAAAWWLGGQSGGPTATISSVTAGEAALRQARANLELVFPSSGTPLVESQPAQARRLLKDAIVALDQAQTAGVSATATATLRAQALGGLDTIDKVRHVAATEIADLGSVIDAPDVGDLTRGPPIENAAYVIERSTKFVYRIDLATGKATAILKAGTTVSRKKVGTPIALTRGGRDVVILDSNGAVWRWRPANAKGAGTLAVITFRGTTDWGDDVIDIAAFDRSAESYNLYIADPSEQQILRYAPAADGSGYPGNPIGYLTAPASLAAVRQVMVDGDVYFLLAGDVERYQSGSKQGFSLTPPEDTDLRPRVDFRLFTGSAARRSGVLELWDASNGRVIEFSKRTGEYIQQWVVSGSQASFSDVRGVYILEPPDGPAVLYWSTGTTLYSSVLQDVSAPTASPSPGSSASPAASPSASPST